MSLHLTGSVAVLGSVSSSLFGTASWALNVLSSSHALTASYVLGGGGGSGVVPDFQSVTTAGNHTSRSIHITSSLTNGFAVRAIGTHSHAEGVTTTAIGWYSHTEGQSSTAIGFAAHAEGLNTIAIGESSHAEGLGTIASGPCQNVQGQFNLPIDDQSALIVGNGIDENNRSNLLVASGYSVQITGSLWVNGTEITGGSEPSLLISSSGESQDPYTIGQPVFMSTDYRSGSLRSSVTVNPDGFGGAGEANVYTFGIGSDSMFLSNQFEQYGQTTNSNIISKRDGSLELSSNFLNIQNSQLVIYQSSATLSSTDGFSGGQATIGVNGNNANIDASIITLPATLIHNYSNDTEAEAAGIPLGGVYHHNGVLQIRHT